MVITLEPTLQEKLRELDILSPVDEETAPIWRAARDVESLNGLVIGFLSNTWASTDKMLGYLREMFEKAYDLKGTVQVSKAVHTRLAAQEIIDDLAERCDLVITGTAG